MEENTTVEAQPITDLNPWSNDTSSQPTPQPEPTNETPTPEPIVEPTPEAKVEPVIQEKIVEVEKIVEKFPEFKDEYSKQIFEALQNGKEDEVFNYLTKKNKNYEVMADVDVVKERLKLDNPTWTDKDVDTEMKYKFGSLPQKKDLSTIDQELEPVEYQKALDFNEAVEQKELLLTREARDARLALNETKKNIEFPKIQQEKAPEVTQPSQEEIDESNRQWEAYVASEMPKLSDFKFKVGDEEISYKITQEDRTSQADYMKDFSGEKVAKDLGWIDENGKENVVKIAEDMLKLKNLDKIIASAATQMKTSATKEVVAEIKNIDLNPSSNTPDIVQDLGSQIWN